LYIMSLSPAASCAMSALPNYSTLYNSFGHNPSDA
jgi:hypothetical protein